MNTIKAGAQQMAGDGGYQLSTPEKHQAFVHKRQMSTKLHALRQIRVSMQRQDEYLATLPQEFQQVVFDNTYANQASHQQDVLLKALFGDLYEDVLWFLYEFTPGKTAGPHVVTQDGTGYIFLTDEDYYTYLEQQ